MKTVTKFRLLFYPVLTALLGLCLWIIMAGESLFAPLIGALLYLVLSRIWRSLLYNWLIAPVLLRELDPKAFLEIHDRLPIFLASGKDRIFAAYYGGDLQTVVSLCTQNLGKKRLKKFYPLYRSFLARVALDTADLQGLERICNEFEAETSEKLRDQFLIMQYYRLWLQKNYAACKALYGKALQTPRQPLEQLGVQLLYHRARLACGEDAREDLERIAAAGGETHLADLARQLLASGTTACPPVPPDPAYEIPGLKRAIRRRRILQVTVLPVVVVLMLFWLLKPPAATTYVIPSEVCRELFGVIPEDLVNGAAPQVLCTPDLATYAELGEDHTLILKLTAEQKRTLQPFTVVDISRPHPNVTETAYAVTVTTDAEHESDHVFNGLQRVRASALQQLVEGVPPAEISVTFSVVDSATGKTVFTDTFPNAITYTVGQIKA